MQPEISGENKAKLNNPDFFGKNGQRINCLAKFVEIFFEFSQLLGYIVVFRRTENYV